MKIKLCLSFLLFVICNLNIYTQAQVQMIDQAIIASAVRISRDLPANARTAVVDFTSVSLELNNYVVKELNGAILRHRSIVPVTLNQSQIQNINVEMRYNSAGELTDDSAQTIGRILEVQYLITGTIEPFATHHRLIFNVVETANTKNRFQYAAPVDLRNDIQLSLLISDLRNLLSKKEQRTEDNEQLTNGQKNRQYGFSIGPQFGFIYAQAVEIVYPIRTRGEYLSELLWNMKPVFYYGIQAEFGLNDLMSKIGFNSNLSFKMGHPGNSGIHENRDWMSIENAALTHYSKHTNKTKELIMIDFKNGVSIPLKYVYITPYVNVSWMRFSFSGSDGSGKYARGKRYDNNGDPIEDNSSNPLMYFPITDNPKIYNFQNVVITYQQDWILAAPGCTVGTSILSPFHFEISYQISPFTYCAAVDNHLTTRYEYRDYTGWGLFQQGTVNASFKWKFFECSLEFIYRDISNTEGESFYKHQNSKIYNPVANKSGAGLSMFDMRLITKFRY